MGRKESKFIPFLKEGLYYRKYINLIGEGDMLSLMLPRKSSKLDKQHQIILKDWYAVKGRRYIYDKSYTEAKQCVEAALRKSEFLECVKKGNNYKVYRFLSKEEIQVKKIRNAIAKQALKMEPCSDSEFSTPPTSPELPLSPSVSALSPGSSGYASGAEVEPTSPAKMIKIEDDQVYGLRHDHVYTGNHQVPMEEMADIQQLLNVVSNHERLVEGIQGSNDEYPVIHIGNHQVPMEEMADIQQLSSMVSNPEQQVEGIQESNVAEYPIAGIYKDNSQFSMVPNHQQPVKTMQKDSQWFNAADAEYPVVSIYEDNSQLNMVSNHEYTVKIIQEDRQLFNAAEYPVVSALEDSEKFEHPVSMLGDSQQPLNTVTNQQYKAEAFNGKIKVKEYFENFQPWGNSPIRVEDPFPIGQWDLSSACNSGFKNPFGNLDLGCLPEKIFADESDKDEENLMSSSTNDAWVPSLEDEKLIDEFFNYYNNLHGSSVEDNLPGASSNVTISSFKTKELKVYEKVNVQTLPGMIILTCQPKMKEICVPDHADDEPNQLRVIFDEETKKLVTMFPIVDLQHFPVNDHLMVFLKCNEPIYESSPLH